MPTINEVRLLGHLARDAEMRMTPNGNAVANFTVITNWGSGDRKKAEFNNCVVWNSKNIPWAEQAAKFRKGDLVLVHGRLETRSWEADGIKKYRTEIMCDQVHFMRSSGGGNHNSDDSDSVFPGLGSMHQTPKKEDPYEEPPF